MHSYFHFRQGFLHHESIQQWERSLNRLRDRGERLINSPDPSYQDALESVHWIQAIDSQKRQVLVDKLVKYLEMQFGIEKLGGELVQTFGKTMYFIRKGICKLVIYLQVDRVSISVYVICYISAHSSLKIYQTLTNLFNFGIIDNYDF